MAGDKLIDAVREAIKVVGCHHKWTEVDISILGNHKKIVEVCDKCGCRQTSYPRVCQQLQQEGK